MFSDLTFQAFSDEFAKIAKKERTEEELDEAARKLELWEKLRAATKTPVHVSPEAELYGGGYFDTKNKEIGLSEEDPDSLAHELGHAELDQYLLGRMIQHPVSRQAFYHTPLAGAIAGAAIGRGHKKGLILPLATATPTILSELLATREGRKKLEEAGATPEEIEAYKKNIGDSFRSYGDIAQQGAAGGILTYLVAKP